MRKFVAAVLFAAFGLASFSALAAPYHHHHYHHPHRGHHHHGYHHHRWDT